MNGAGDVVGEETGDERPVETIREMEDELERLAATDLPIAPFARNALDALGGEDTHE